MSILDLLKYSVDLETAIAITVNKWINENVKYPGVWTTHLDVFDEDNMPIGPSTRIN